MMEIQKRTFTFDSVVTGEHIFVRVVEPACREQAVAVLMVTHGMAEYGGVYEDYASFMAEHGYVVVVQDHLGHGRSVAEGEDFGYFGNGGCHNLVMDMKKLHTMLRDDYEPLPFFLFGHSMGSFLARTYMARFGGDMKAAVFMGTSAGSGKIMAGLQQRALQMLIRRKGPKGHDPLPEKLSTGAYNKSFAPNRTANDWVSSDEEEVDRYTRDPLCGFPLTVSGYRDVAKLLDQVNQSLWYQRIPKDTPMLLISGEQDPVGDFGKGVRKVYERMKKVGCQVQLKLYPSVRHALITEKNRQEVFGDLLAILEGALPQSEREEAVAC